MKKGSGLRTALSEALDPSLIAMASASAVDEYDEDEEDEEEATLSAKKPSKAKARTKSKDASDSEQPNGKKRRPSAETAKSKPTKRSVHDDEDEEDSPKVLGNRFEFFYNSTRSNHHTHLLFLFILAMKIAQEAR